MDEHAAATYAANFGDDARRRRQDRGRRGRSPRPTSSSAGRPARASRRSTATASASSDARSGASTCARSRESDAEAFVMENVPELLRSAEYAAFKKAAEDELGFRVEGRILNAADYGVPQRRRRAIVIGVRDGEIPWPDADALRPRRRDPARRASRGGRSATPSTGLPRKPTGKDWHIGRNPRPETHHPLPARPARRRQPLPDAGQPRRRQGSATSSRRAGGTSRPARPTSSVGSTGSGRRSRSAPSSTSPRRAATSTRARTGRSRSARPRAA